MLQKSPPKLRHLGLEAGLCKIIHPAADDIFPRKPEKLAGAGTGLPVLAFVVRDQDGRGRVVDDSPEQHLEGSGTVFHQPAGGLRLCVSGLHKLSPSLFTRSRDTTGYRTSGPTT